METMKIRHILAGMLAAMLMTGAALAEQVSDVDEPLPLLPAAVSFDKLPALPPEETEESESIRALFQPIPWDAERSPNPPQEACFLPDDAGYHDDSLDIRVETFRAFDTNIMAVYVTLTDVSQFRTSLAARYPSKTTVVVSTMAKKAGAVLAMSGDYFNFHDQGIAMRNGMIYREKPTYQRDTLIVDKNGDFTIIPHTTMEQWNAVKDNAVHAFCFGPGLVVDGVQLTDASDINLNIGKNKVTQRIALAQVGPLQYAIIATEGPENPGSRGLTLLEMAQLCADMGFQNAFNMDGGSSSTIVLNNRKINSVSSHKIRPVGDCIWFATLVN